MRHFEPETGVFAHHKTGKIPLSRKRGNRGRVIDLSMNKGMRIR